MSRRERPLSNAERGQASILIVLALALFLLPFIGFAVDYASAFAQRRKLQTAADAACQAGALDLLLYAEGAPTPNMNFTPVLAGSMSCATNPTAAPCLIAKKNGFDGVSSNSVTLSFPSTVNGQGGPAGVDIPFIRVDASSQVPSYFSQLVTFKRTITVRASASCGITAPDAPAPITVLHPSASGALSVGGILFDQHYLGDHSAAYRSIPIVPPHFLFPP